MHVIFRVSPISRDESFPGIPQDITNQISLGPDDVQTGMADKAIHPFDRVLRLLFRIVARPGPTAARFWQFLTRDSLTRAVPRPKWPR